MESDINWIINKMPKSSDNYLAIMSVENITCARKFHSSFPQYSVTPLVQLGGMANHLGVANIFVKDESYRFGLNAFKVLGSSFAIMRYIAKETERDISECDFTYLTSDQLQKDFGQATFFTATDGNHGRGVAWAANHLRQKCVVRMPQGSAKTRLQNIAKEGAEVTIEMINYDDCVRMAAQEAEACANGVIMQDTAWDGYEEIPSWIMQGYGTLAAESVDQLRNAGVNRPTHIFVQAGVGSLASAIVGYFSNIYADNPPVFVVMEAQAADCLFQGAKASDGNPRLVDGNLSTIMAGLACGEPNTIGWDILRNHATAFLSCPDWVAALGMRMLAAPVKGDIQVVSGESGAVGMGALSAILQNDSYASLRTILGLGADSQVLLISTEGDTDPERYREIVWEGSYSLNK